MKRKVSTSGKPKSLSRRCQKGKVGVTECSGFSKVDAIINLVVQLEGRFETWSTDIGQV